MSNFSDWSLLRSFLAVMREGSLSAAARAAGLTQPTVGRHIAELEKSLGIPLFTRSPGGLMPTAAAGPLVSHAEAMEVSFKALVRVASASGDTASPRGTVRITTSEIMGIFILPMILGQIRERYPDIIFELVLNNRTEDLLRRDADIAVRMARPRQDGLVARNLGSVPLAFYAHRDYLARYGMPRTLQDLEHLHVIGFDHDNYSARAVVGGKLPISRDIFAFRTDSDAAQVSAIRAGLGIGMIQHALAKTDPSLLPVLVDQMVIDLECWLVIHEDQRSLPHIRVVFDGLADGLTRWLIENQIAS